MVKIKEVVQSHLSSHRQVSPANKYVVAPSSGQLDLFDYWGHGVSASNMGLFYELVTKAVYGGELFDSFRDCKFSLPQRAWHPDVLDGNGKRVYEAKACRSGSTLVLRDDQVKGYRELQLALPDHEMFFALYRHNFKGIRDFKGTQDELYSALSDGTLFSVVAPFSLIDALVGYATHAQNGLATRSNSKIREPSSRVSSRAINKLFDDPKYVIEKLGLSLDDYGLDRVIVPGVDIRFPESESGKDASYTISGIPIVAIFDKNHSRWRDSFLNRAVSEEGCSDLEEAVGENFSESEIAEEIAAPF